MAMLSCDKTELVPDIPHNDVEISYKAQLALEGKLCTPAGIPVSVITDTLYPRYISTGSTYRADTLWFTEYFYIMEYGNMLWCNEDCLIECGCN